MQNKKIGKKIGKYLVVPLLAASLLKTGCDYQEDMHKGETITTIVSPNGRTGSETLGRRWVLYNEKADKDANNGLDWSAIPRYALAYNRAKGVDVDVPFFASQGLFWVPEGCVKQGYEKNIIKKADRFLNILDLIGFDE